MEAENKLDKDFLFYLNFINNAFHSLRDDLDKHRSYVRQKEREFSFSCRCFSGVAEEALLRTVQNGGKEEG